MIAVAIVAGGRPANVVLLEERFAMNAIDILLVLIRLDPELAHVLGVGMAMAARGRDVGRVDR